MKTPYLILGADGQVGSALLKILGKEAIGLNRKQADLLQPEKLPEIFDSYKPQIIINAAAYTAVDNAEDEPEIAHKINAEALSHIAHYCFKNDILLVHYSTDYVFSGEGYKPWKENDKTGPLNVYGRTKLEGENNIIIAAEKYKNARFLIFRTSWIYAENGKNFANTMLNLGAQKESLKVVDDQVGSPTYAADLADYSCKIIKSALQMEKFPSGIYHLCNSGAASWHDFAGKIFELAGKYQSDLKIKEVLAISSDEYTVKAKRPLNSRLDNGKVFSVFNLRMPLWEDALKRCFRNKFGR